MSTRQIKATMKRTALGFLLGVVGLVSGNLHAAPITWGPAMNVVNDSDVSTNGVLQYAEHWGGTDGTINGVAFTAAGTHVIKSDSGNTATVSWTQGTLSATYYGILRGTWYRANPGTTVTLNSLVSGHIYQIQIWAMDKRYSASQYQVISGGPSLSIQTGQYAVGTFTADAATQVITSGTGSAGIFNAVQVRDVTGLEGPVDAGTSTVAASPNVVPADGSTASTITVTLKDAIGIPITNKVVFLTSSRGASDTISGASGPSSAFGVVTFTVTSSTSGNAVFSATDVTDGNLAITQTASVGFVGPVNAGTSTVAVSPASVGADGTVTALLTVTLRDANGLPVSGKTVTMASSRGATDTISAASGPSSASGTVSFSVASTTLGTAVFSATDVTDGNLAITQTASVNFVTLVIGAQQFSAGDVLPSPIIAVSGDLLETSVSSVTGEIATQKPRNGTTGTAMENSTQDSAATQLATVTYQLDMTASSGGYDITEIRLFSGWDGGRAGQSYRISYSLAGTPATFIDLGTVSALRLTTGSLLTRTYDLTGAKILKGVAGLRFTMIDNGNAGVGTVFREFDVLGVKTPPKGTMIQIF